MTRSKFNEGSTVVMGYGGASGSGNLRLFLNFIAEARGIVGYKLVGQAAVGDTTTDIREDMRDLGLLDDNDNIVPGTGVELVYFFINTGRAPIFYDSPSTYNGKKFTVEWEGNGAFDPSTDLERFGVPTLNPDGDDTATKKSLTMNQDFSNSAIIFHITDPDDPALLSSVKFYEKEHAVEVAAGDVFHPHFKEASRTWGIFRWMDMLDTNWSKVREFDEFAKETNVFWASRKAGDEGRQGMPIKLICDLANEQRHDPWVNIPHLMTDQGIADLANFVFANLDADLIPHFEYTNEAWNSGFGDNSFGPGQYDYMFDIGEPIWGAGDGTRHRKGYGYRAAQVMNIIRQNAPARNRWYGVWGSQGRNISVTTDNKIGVDYALANDPALSGLTYTDLFDGLAVAGYYGGQIDFTRRVTSVVKTDATTLTVTTSADHLWSVSDEVIFKRMNTGMVELDGEYHDVASVPTSSTFTITVADTSAYTDYADNGQQMVATASYYREIDAGLADFAAGREVSEYSRISRQFQQDLKFGTASINWAGSSFVDDNISPWTAQFNEADAMGLELIQYEGGVHVLGNPVITGQSGEPDWETMIVATGYSEEMADAQNYALAAWEALGGVKPAKFVMAGEPGNNAWGMFRYYGEGGTPDYNPVSMSWVRANDSPRFHVE